jgi:nucleotide-binding universal stress UspA family protein
MALTHAFTAGTPAATALNGYRAILVPVNTALPELPIDIVDVASRLAAERRSAIVLLAFTEIPLWEEMEVEMPGMDDHIQEMAAAARAIALRHGVGIHVTAPRTRAPADLILAESARRGSQLIVLGATGRSRNGHDMPWRDATMRRVSDEARARTMFIQGPVAV